MKKKDFVTNLEYKGQGNYGTYSYYLHFRNGDKGYYNSKQQQCPFVVGAEHEYYYDTSSKYAKIRTQEQHEYLIQKRNEESQQQPTTTPPPNNTTPKSQQPQPQDANAISRLNLQDLKAQCYIEAAKFWLMKSQSTDINDATIEALAEKLFNGLKRYLTK